MPRKNLLLLLTASIVSVICFRQADSAHRSEHGRMFDTFSEVLKEVDAHYLREVDNRQLFEGALHGMMTRLDPYSAYISPERYGEFISTLEQKFGGIGIEVGVDPETKALVVTTPMADSPAFAAGVRAGDVIQEIDGDSTEGWDLEDAVRRMRGKRGAVRVKVLHQGDEEPTEITIDRAVIPVHSVLGESRDADNHWNFFLPGDERIGYVRITTFGENTLDELEAALSWLAAREARGVILDLRNNRGGVFDGAIKTCDLFVDQGPIVSTRGRGGVEIQKWVATGKAPYPKLPLVVLINQHTASAAEIVAACLQDDHRAILVGQRTWGKGTVQEVIHLEGGKSLLKLTTASYWRPSGQDIHRYPDTPKQENWGVQPDDGYKVERTEEETTELIKHRHDRDVVRAPGVANAEAETPDQPASDDDPQLARAIEAMRTLLAK